MIDMRAKFIVTGVEVTSNDKGETVGERWTFAAVAKSGGYPDDGHDDDNTFARWSPSANLVIYCVNPALFGNYKVNDKVYADFTPAN